MVLYLIGLGLCDEKNITLRGLEYIKSSDYIYMEYYTSILSVDKSKLESLYEKQIILAEREMIESNSEILSKVKEHKVSLLVVVDPFIP
jgi:diphthine synthase